MACIPTSYPILHKVYRHEHANATTDEKVVLKSGQDEDCEHGQHRWEPLLQVAMEVGSDPLVDDRVPHAKVLGEIAAVPPILEGVKHSHTHTQTDTHTKTHTDLTHNVQYLIEISVCEPGELCSHALPAMKEQSVGKAQLDKSQEKTGHKATHNVISTAQK